MIMKDKLYFRRRIIISELNNWEIVLISKGDYDGFDEEELTSETGGKARVIELLK